jgi:hypothetical protein
LLMGVDKSPTGILATPNDIVNINSVPRIPSNIPEAPNSNDFLNEIRIILTYILPEKYKRKRYK